MMATKIELTPIEIDRIIEMAWEDRTPFDAIFNQFGLKEQEVKAIMRKNMKQSSWLLWRKRVNGRKTKHLKTSENSDFRFKCNRQRTISNNKISKKN